MLSKDDKLLIEVSVRHFCDARVPERVRDQVRVIYRWERNIITIIETRRCFQDQSRWTECPIARLRYTSAARKWTLYFIGRGERWCLYDELKPVSNIQVLLDEVNRDPEHIFWG